MTTAPRRRRSVSVTLGVTALVAAGLTGCAPEVDNQAICVDPQTEERVDDDYCEDDDHHGGGYAWYYMRAGTRAPAVGSTYASTKGTFDSSTLRGSTSTGGVDSDGGTISRGGFGGGGSSGS